MLKRNIQDKLIHFFHNQRFLSVESNEIYDLYERKENEKITTQIFIEDYYITIKKFIKEHEVKYFRSDKETFQENFDIIYSFIK